MNRRKTIITACLLVALILLIGTTAVIVGLRPPSLPTDSYLSYEKLTNGPGFSFTGVSNGASNNELNAHYREEGQTNYYYFLDHISPEEMLIVNESSLEDRTEQTYLIYDPKKVSDPWELLKPCKAVLLVGNENNEYKRIEFDDSAVWESLWQTLMETEPTTESKDFEHSPQVSLTLYVESDERVQIKCSVEKKDGALWYVFTGMSYRQKYIVPCDGTILSAITEYWENP